MFTGTKEGNTTGGSYLKTGLSSFSFLGVNPSAEQISKWTGRENVQQPSYDLTKDFNQNDVRPINIWLKNDDVVVNFRINIGNVDAIAKSGNYQVCTSTGAVVWAKQGGSLKPEFADHKPLKVGEAELIEFISKLINFDQKSGENLYLQMTSLGVDANSLYNANYTGMNKLAAWSQEKAKHIVMCLVVREKDALDENGNTITKRYQAVANDSKTWFHGQVTDWAEKKLLERYEKSLEVGAGQTQAYPIIKDLFTIIYQDFKREDCFNAVPDNPTASTSGMTWNS